MSATPSPAPLPAAQRFASLLSAAALARSAIFDSSACASLAFAWGSQCPLQAERFAQEVAAASQGCDHAAHVGCILAGMAYFGSLHGRGMPSPFRLSCCRTERFPSAPLARMEGDDSHAFPTPGVQYVATVAFYVAVRHAFDSRKSDPQTPWLFEMPEEGCLFMQRCSDLFDLTCAEEGKAPLSAWAEFAELAKQAALADELELAIPFGAPSPWSSL